MKITISEDSFAAEAIAHEIVKHLRSIGVQVDDSKTNERNFNRAKHCTTMLDFVSEDNPVRVEVI